MSGTIGSGSDSIVLKLSEDQQAGVDANFTVNVDGQQIGGVQSVSASHSAGQDDTFTFLGNFAPGPHTLGITFTNNFSLPGSGGGDRNLYVDGVTYDGQTVSNTTTEVWASPLFPPNSTTGNYYGNAVYTLNDTTAASGTPVGDNTTPGPVSVGSGSDTLVLNMAEDPYQGDAQFTVAVDGKQVGGDQTVTASVEQGQFQEFDVHGGFGSGSHSVTVTFLNDKIGAFYAGTSDAVDTTDRNLYVMGASLDGGTPASNTPWEQATGGSETFNVTAGSNPSATATNSGLFGTDGAPANTDNAAIPSGSLSSGSPSSGSSSGMSFISSGSGSGSGSSASDAGSSGSGGSGGNSAGSGSSDAASGADITAAASSSGQGTSDFSVPTPAGSTSSADSGGSGGQGTWWTDHHHASGSFTPAQSST